MRTRPLVWVERRACSLYCRVPLTRRWLQIGRCDEKKRWGPRCKGQLCGRTRRTVPGHARDSAASLSELRPRYACSVRTRTRHPGAAAGCAGAAGRGAWSPRGAWSAAHCAQRSAAPLAARARVGSWCCRGHRLHRRCLLLRRRRPAAHSLPRQRAAFPKWLPLPGPWQPRPSRGRRKGRRSPSCGSSTSGRS